MTVCAWDGKTLATDSQVTKENITYKAKKLFVIKGKAIAMAGTFTSFIPFAEWIEKGARVKSYPEFLMLEENGVEAIVVSGQQVLTYEANSPYPMELYGNVAIGCGATYALAAMACGKGSIEAVEVACEFDPGCGGDIQYYTLE